MSMVINLVEDHNIYLCEGGPVYNGGVQPTPITYLTQWKIVGNSQVHTDPYLTSWKVSGNSQVHTLPYPDGVVLPNGYKRCKYLTFDGSSYIDTGIIPEQGIGVSIKFKFLEKTGGDNGIFGCRSYAWSADSFYCFRQITTRMLFVSYGGFICDSNSTGNFVINANDEIELHLDSSFLSFTNGTNTLTKSISSQITKGTKTLYIGAINGYGSKSRIMLRTFVLTNGVGNTIFNGIPCLDDNNVPCLYDTVSGTSFYNDGTGTFGYELYPQPTEIWSCGEYNATDGKYHILVKPQGGSIADIALTEPLRKVNDVADSIEFPSDIEGKALVTRNLALLSTTKFIANHMDSQNKLCLTTDSFIGANYKQNENGNILCNKIEKGLSIINARTYGGECFAMQYANVWVRNGAIAQTVESYQSYFDSLGAIEVVYELATPTTELVDAPQIAVSPTDTYTSANVTPYSAFEHTKHSEIWSCGEYNATDGKYHILVQPLGGSIADIALDAPLRKVNNVADTIEFPSGTEGKALVTRNIDSQNLGNYDYRMISAGDNYRAIATTQLPNVKTVSIDVLANILCASYTTITSSNTSGGITTGIALSSQGNIVVYDDDYNQEDSVSAFETHVSGVEVIYELATPTKELVDAPQIEEADSYSMVISQGGKAVEWSSFETNSE